MILYLLRRTMTLLVTLFFLLQLSFCVVYISQSAPLHKLPFSEAYLLYFSHLIEGNVGFGVGENHKIISKLQYALPATLELCLLGFILALLIGIPTGIMLGINHGKKIDKILKAISLLASATPLIWLALLAILLFSIYDHWLPAFGRYDSHFKPHFITGFIFIDVWFMPQKLHGPIILDAIKHLLLPVIVLSLAPMVEVVRLMQYSTENVFKKNYIKAAFSRGLSTKTIVWRHVLHNALPPIVPQLGIQFSMMLTLTMFTEIMFKWPGLGPWIIDAFHYQEYAVIALVLLLVGSLIALINMIGDIIGVFFNPLRYKEKYALQ